MNQETLEDIDNHISTWTDRIKDATDRTTPTIQYRVLPGAQPKALNYDPRVFSESTKTLMGNSTTISPHVIHNDERLYDPQRQEPVFRQFWQNVFTDEDPDNNNFDYDYIQKIEDSVNDRINRTVPYDKSNLTRLDNNKCPPHPPNHND